MHCSRSVSDVLTLIEAACAQELRRIGQTSCCAADALSLPCAACKCYLLCIHARHRRHHFDRSAKACCPAEPAALTAVLRMLCMPCFDRIGFDRVDAPSVIVEADRHGTTGQVGSLDWSPCCALLTIETQL